MELQTVLFIGRSGCGKGTQAKLFIDELHKRNPEVSVLSVQTGSGFRDFMNKPGYTNKLLKDSLDQGGLAPNFLGVWNWSDQLVRGMQGNEHLVMDGPGRAVVEAKILDSAFKFYNRPHPKILHLEVSREWSETRLHERGRVDDQNQAYMEEKHRWYQEDVVPALNFFREMPEYAFFDINGEQPIEAVAEEVRKKVFLND